MPYETYTWTDTQAIGAYLFNRYVRDPLAYLYNHFPLRVTCWHDQSLVVAGNAITTATLAGQPHNIIAYQNAAALNDEWTQSICLVGNVIYQYTLLYQSGPNSGTMALYMDDIQMLEPFDMYAAGLTANQSITQSWFVEESKRILLTGIMEGKNGSSGGYQARLTYISFHPLVSGGGDF